MKNVLTKLLKNKGEENPLISERHGSLLQQEKKKKKIELQLTYP